MSLRITELVILRAVVCFSFSFLFLFCFFVVCFIDIGFSISLDTMLPFRTIQEAEVAMGRSLSYWESIWFRYSARMPDSLLYCHNILFLFVIFSFVPLPLVFMDINKVKTFEKYKLQPRIYHPLSRVFDCYKTVLYVFFTVVGPLQLSSYPVVKLVGIRTGLPLPSWWEIIAQLTVYFMVEDYGNYWIHRWLHCKWGYEKIHRVHHEFTAPMGFAAPYAHWAEVLILGIPSFLGPAIAPGHMVTFWLWIALRQIEAIDTHSGYDFPWSPTKLIPFYGGPEYHDYHHYVGGQSQSNFASVFTYCDYIYGTDKGYRYQKEYLLKLRKASALEGNDWMRDDGNGEAPRKVVEDQKSQ